MTPEETRTPETPGNETPDRCSFNAFCQCRLHEPWRRARAAYFADVLKKALDRVYAGELLMVQRPRSFSGIAVVDDVTPLKQ